MDKIDRFDGEYRFLSNFYPSKFLDENGVEWLTVEQAYQAAKTLDPNEQVKIWMEPNPGKNKRQGREVTMRKDWELIKVAVMYTCLRKKFSIPMLRNKLLATGTAELIEGNDWGDTYWGQVDGVGENMLGRLLMAIRSEIWDEE